jgi:hypothetical protein
VLLATINDDAEVSRWECSGVIAKICEGRIGNQLRIKEEEIEVAERIQMAQQGEMIRVTALLEDGTQSGKWI